MIENFSLHTIFLSINIRKKAFVKTLSHSSEKHTRTADSSKIAFSKKNYECLL
jgi:hypothetical protein